MITSGPAGLTGLQGNIGGVFTVGAITVNGSLQTAPVTGSGTFSIVDAGGFALSGTLQWLDVFTLGTTGGTNVGGTVNLTGLTYTGSNADLIALRNLLAASVVSSFQFVPGIPLTDLVNGGINSTSYSGTLTARVPEPSLSWLLAGAVAIFAVMVFRRERGGAEGNFC
jgi:hypothetical protein